MVKSFDTYLAESGQQSTLDQLRGSGQYEAAKSQYESGGSSVQSGAYAGQPNFESTLSRAMEIQKQAAQPAIQSLQQSIPEIQKSYSQAKTYGQSQVSNLESRYKSLLDSIKTNQAGAETTATKTTSQELGRRGIVGSSGVADVALQDAVNPIRAQYSGLLSQTGIAQEQDIGAARQNLTNISNAETEAIRNVNNAIAQLQGATTTNGVNQAIQQLQLAQSQYSASQQASQFDTQQALAEKIYETVTLPSSQASIKNAGSSSGGMNVSDLLSLFGGQTQTMQKTGFPNIDKLISEGKYDEARSLLLNP